MALSLTPYHRMGKYHGNLQPSCFVIKRIKYLSNYIALKEFTLSKLLRAGYPPVKASSQEDLRYQSPEKLAGKDEEYLDK